MKKIIAIICALCMILSVCACSSQTSEVSEQSEYASRSDLSDVSVTGRVTEIVGNSVTLQVGELTAVSEDYNGQPPAKPDGDQNGQPPVKPDGDQNGQPPAKPDGDQNGQPPAKPDGDQNGQPPAKPDGDQNGQPPVKPDGDQNGQPPAKPDGDQNGQPPAKPDGDQNGQPPAKPDGDQNGQPPVKPDDGQQPDGSDDVPILDPDNGNGDMPADFPPMGGQVFTEGDETVTVDLSGVEITSGSASISVNDIKVGDILTVIFGDDDSPVSALVVDLGGGQQPGGLGGNFGGGSFTQGDAANTISEDGTYSGNSYSSTGDDENALRIDEASVTLDGILVEKSAGATSNTENGDFYGVNAALLATNGANVTITGAMVNSSAQNGNGVFSYGSGTVVNISDSVITTTKDNSGGIQTTGGGTTNASSLTVNTAGNSSAAIRSDRGGGTVNVSGGSYTSTGYGSPAVYSTADISVKNAVLTANNSEALVIEGKNSIALENCDVTGNMTASRNAGSDANMHNVMIYQSMSGDAEVGTATFSMKGSTLTSNNGDVIYVTNTRGIITLSGVAINNNGGGYLLNVCGNSDSRGWGKAGSNGAQVEFTAEAQNLTGDIIVDTISTLNMTMTNGTVFTGMINIVDNEAGGAAVSDNAVITIDSGSTWSLTGNCKVTSLVNNGTINYNGYTITLSDGTVLG